MSALPSPPRSPTLDDVWSVADPFSPTTDMYSNYAPSSVPSTSSPSSIHGTSDDNDDRHAASIALRRQRNRESMRRTRQRAKETLTALRATVARLESQYAQLLTTPDADASSTASTERRAFIERLQARLVALVQIRRTLESENGAVHAQIQQRQALEAELQQILEANELDDMINEKLALLGLPSAAPSNGFTPISPMEAHRVIDAFCRELAHIHNASASASASAASPPPLEVFGWRAHRHIDAVTEEMHFELSKRFDHITALEMTTRAWAEAMDLDHFRATERDVIIRRLEFLQHLSDDVKAMVRETVHPIDGTIFRTNYLTFKIPVRRPDGDGMLIGMRSINPPVDPSAPVDGERIVWIDIFVSVELMSCGPRSCVVRWRGRTNYHSTQYAAENAVRFLMGVLRWEQGITGPLIQLY